MRCTYIRGGVHINDYTDGLNLFDPAVDGAGVEEEVGAAGGAGGGGEGLAGEGLAASHEEQRISTMMILRPCRNLTHHALVIVFYPLSRVCPEYLILVLASAKSLDVQKSINFFEKKKVFKEASLRRTAERAEHLKNVFSLHFLKIYF
jgi:hypothetical protein